ncbi:methionine ABC transporter ATP-binding protein [Halalkalibacter lacteus]|uniref:methionine ABC transporter ATP-binding protein n=1 Tax=Halalkalibacter lacteus TaxID=3090663 RepID=UPI002FCB9F91
MIELKDVCKTYFRQGITNEALKDIQLTVEKGDIYGVIGYSGAGKSTLIRLVNYLEKPTSGQVFVEGKALDSFTVRELRTVKKGIGMIFQHFNLLNSKSVYHNVALPLILSKKSKREINARVTELLEFVGLSDKASSFPNELSGGQKQRVGIARALASNPSILLCDEATSALDPQTTRSILQLLKKINIEYNITIMIITHEMSVIQEICNKVAVMEKGEIIEQGTVLEVFGHPQHPTTKTFVETVIHKSIPPSVKRLIKMENGSRIYSLEIIGDRASEPLVDSLIRSHDVKVNILFANISELQDTTLVNMYLQLQGEPSAIDKAIVYLTNNGAVMKEVVEK